MRAAVDRLFGASSTLPDMLLGGAWKRTVPGTLTGVSGSFASRRSFQTAIAALGAEVRLQGGEELAVRGLLAAALADELVLERR